MLWIVSYLKGNATDCIEDPMTYFETKNEGASCHCMNGGKYYQREGEETNQLSNLLLNYNDIKD